MSVDRGPGPDQRRSRPSSRCSAPRGTSASSSAFAADLTQQVAGTHRGQLRSRPAASPATPSSRRPRSTSASPTSGAAPTPTRGLDCSGLVQLVYKNLGYDLPRVSDQQATAGTAVKGGLADAQPGDILALRLARCTTSRIYIGDGKMIEAPRPGLAVRIAEVYETPTAIRRILPEGAAHRRVRRVTMRGTTSRVPAGTPYADLFQAAAAKYGVDATLLAAVARQESGFNAKAVSPAGAQGLMQLMPGTAAGLGVTNSFDPAQAVDGAARLLQEPDAASSAAPTSRSRLQRRAGRRAPVRRHPAVPRDPELRPQHHGDAPRELSMTISSVAPAVLPTAGASESPGTPGGSATWEAGLFAGLLGAGGSPAASGAPREPGLADSPLDPGADAEPGDGATELRRTCRPPCPTRRRSWAPPRSWPPRRSCR